MISLKCRFIHVQTTESFEYIHNATKLRENNLKKQIPQDLVKTSKRNQQRNLLKVQKRIWGGNKTGNSQWFILSLKSPFRPLLSVMSVCLSVCLPKKRALILA